MDPQSTPQPAMPVAVTAVKKGVSPLLVFLLLVLTAVAFTVVGVVASQYLLPKEQVDNVVDKEDDVVVTKVVEEEDVDNDGMSRYVSNMYSFAFDHPDSWQVSEEAAEPNYRGSVKVFKGEYMIQFDIMSYPNMPDMGGWGPEPCVYSDTTANLEDFIAIGYVEYNDFVQIDTPSGSFRRSMGNNPGEWSVCSSSTIPDDNLYGTNSFEAIEEDNVQDRAPLSGFIDYYVPVSNVSPDLLAEMDQILASVELALAD